MIRGACGAFHVDAKRQGYVGMAECYGVDSLVESESAGHAVAEHLHDRSRQRQPQIVREKGREIFLECVRSAEGENERTNLILRQTARCHRLDHERRQDLVLQYLDWIPRWRLQLPVRTCRPADHRNFTCHPERILIPCRHSCFATAEIHGGGQHRVHVLTVLIAYLPPERDDPSVPSAGKLFFGDRVGDFERVAMLRSEEHTSELQSLMRTSYAVF